MGVGCSGDGIYMLDDEFLEESPWSAELTELELEELRAWERDERVTRV